MESEIECAKAGLLHRPREPELLASRKNSHLYRVRQPNRFNLVRIQPLQYPHRRKRARSLLPRRDNRRQSEEVVVATCSSGEHHYVYP